MNEVCEVCGKRLTKEELAKYEAICYDCLNKETQGLINDDYKELDFDNE